MFVNATGSGWSAPINTGPSASAHYCGAVGRRPSPGPLSNTHYCGAANRCPTAWDCWSAPIISWRMPCITVRLLVGTHQHRAVCQRAKMRGRGAVPITKGPLSSTHYCGAANRRPTAWDRWSAPIFAWPLPRITVRLLVGTRCLGAAGRRPSAWGRCPTLLSAGPLSSTHQRGASHRHPPNLR